MELGAWMQEWAQLGLDQAPTNYIAGYWPLQVVIRIKLELLTSGTKKHFSIQHFPFLIYFIGKISMDDRVAADGVNLPDNI